MSEYKDFNPVESSFRPVRTNRRRRRRSPFFAVLLTLVVILLLVGAVGIGGLLAYENGLRDQIVPGVTVLGEAVGGLTEEQAAAHLRTKFSDPALLLNKLGGEPIVLRDGPREFRVWPWELGWTSDMTPAVTAAFAIGHHDNLALNLNEQLDAMLHGQDVNIGTAFDPQSAALYVDTVARQIDVAPRNASLTIRGLQASETLAQNGRQVDRAETLRRIQARMAGQVGGQVQIAVRELPAPALDSATAKAQIDNFLAAPLILTFEQREWAIDQGTLVGMIELKQENGKYTAGLNHAALAAAIGKLTRDINQPARDAKLHFDGGALTPIVTSQDGRLLDAEASARAVETKFAQGASARLNGAASPLDALQQARVPLAVRITKPSVDLRDKDKFGIKEVVSVGQSNFFHSIPGRIQNVKTATAQFDGIVVPPGAIFSFDANLGDVVEAEGYEDAYVIFGDRTVLGPGGGVCQVSTTAFRAAFWGGFPIVERWAHDYRVGYYEPPVGLDATVFSPSVDFKFKNDTGAYLLIETRTDVKNFELTFTFYGTKPNRKVTMEGPISENPIKAPAPLYTNDPTLAKGVTKQVDFQADGLDVTIIRSIEENGQVRKDKFVSKYKPWQARYLVGTRE